MGSPSRAFTRLFVAVVVLINLVAPRAMRGEDLRAFVTLTTTKAIRNLPPQEAAQNRPVLLRATVTYYDRPEHVLFVQDATGGVFLDAGRELPIEYGSTVLVKGTTLADFTNVVKVGSVEELSHGHVPRPKAFPIQALASGQQDCEYITTTGVVRVAYVARELRSSYLELRLEDKGRSLDASILNYGDLRPESLIDATVRVTGAVGGNFNNQQQLTGVLIHAQTGQDVQVIRDAPVNPFKLPVRQLGQVFKSRFDSETDVRSHLQGSVTYYQPGRLMVIQDGTAGMMIHTSQTDRARVGERTDVTGFPVFGAYGPILIDAVFREAPPHAVIEPVASAKPDMLDGSWDSKLISVDGTLLNVTSDPTKQTLVVQVKKQLLSGVLEGAPKPGTTLNLRTGSRVRLTGVCVVESGGIWQTVRGYQLLLRGPSDVEVLSVPSWWDARKLGYALISLLLAVGGSFAWVAILRRRVKAQTNEIRRVLEEDAERDKQWALLQAARSRVLELINSREPLGEVLDAIVAMLEQQHPGSCCLIQVLPPENDPLATAETELLDFPANMRKPGGGEASLPIISAQGQMLGAISVVWEGSEMMSPELLDSASQLASLAIENRRLFETLVQQSQRDALTGLPNRSSLEKEVAQRLRHATKAGEKLALVYLDLDGFKEVNDAYGHQTGDEYLQAIAGRFRGAVREDDVVCRFGGDEFVAMLAGVEDRAHAEEISFRMAESLDEPVTLHGGMQLPCSTSYGVAVFPEDGGTLDDLKRVADLRMYASKSKRKAVRRSELREDANPLGWVALARVSSGTAVETED